MFLGITEPFEDGDTFPVTLAFETAGEVTVEVPVDLSRLTEDGAAGMDHDAMEGMDHGGHAEEAGEGQGEQADHGDGEGH